MSKAEYSDQVWMFLTEMTSCGRKKNFKYWTFWVDFLFPVVKTLASAAAKVPEEQTFVCVTLHLQVFLPTDFKKGQ